jgi:pyruvate formate lyase activating enzyme
MPTLQDVLSARTREAAPELVQQLGGERLRCFACGHQCPIPAGAVGVCKVRYNRGGRLQVPWGYVGGVQCDPVEKKPFFHVYPGALAYSFGMLGCDLHCSYCQNWVTSQALRDPHAGAPPQDTTPHSLVQDALRQGARLVVSTYNEPLITAEWATAIFTEAREQGLATAFVSNGNGTPRVLEYLRPHIDAYKVDLKSFDDRRYRELGGRLQPILDTISWLHGAGVWVEIVTLLVPGFNDSDAELTRLTTFIASVSPDIPWHVTAFHQDYKMTGPENTTPAMLLRAATIARRSGLRYVYAGNQPGRVGELEHTDCASCGERLIGRYGYFIQEYRLTPDSACPRCHAKVPGLWSQAFEGQRTAFPFLPHDRTRLSVI